MTSQVPNFDGPLDWTFVDNLTNVYVREEIPETRALTWNGLKINPKEEYVASSSPPLDDLGGFEWIGEDKPMPIEKQWCKFTTSSPFWFVSMTNISDKPGLRERSFSYNKPTQTLDRRFREDHVDEESELASLLPRGRSLSAPPVLNSLDWELPLKIEELLHWTPVPSPDYSELFPKEFVDKIGIAFFSRLPFCDLSEKNIADLQLEDFTNPIMIFSGSKEGYSGIAMKTFLKEGWQIEVYYGDRVSTKNWFYRSKQANKQDAQKTIQSERIAAALKPASICLIDYLSKIEARLRFEEFKL